MTERPVSFLQRALKVFSRRENDSGGEILLGRLPAEIRQRIWEAPQGQIREVLTSINLQLEAQGIKPITGHEFQDALEGNDFMHNYGGVTGTH